MRLLRAALPAVLFAAGLQAETYAVLPFFNQTTDHNLDWIGESIAESIRETLSSEGAITIDRKKRGEAYSRLGVRPYVLLTKATVLKIGQTLDSGQILYGQFELEKDSRTPANSRGTLRISAQILDLGDLKRGPDFVAIGALEDLASLQTHLSWQALQFLLPETSPSEDEFRRQRRPVRVDAIEHYIRGLLATNAEVKQKFLLQAARLDPGYMPPCMELGRHYWNLEDYRNASEWLARVRPSDPQYLEASFLRGVARHELKDFKGAETAFAALVEDAPLSEVHNNIGAALVGQQKPRDALAHFQRAIEGDANDPVYLFNLGYARWLSGDFKGAAESFRATLERDPDDEQAKDLLARSRRETGPVQGDEQTKGLERLKYEFELSAYRQLRSILEGGKK